MMDSAAKKEMVEGMFDDIAPTYDALNHLLSLGVDRGWRRRVVRMVGAGPACSTILDIATGTGDLAIALAQRAGGGGTHGVHVTGVDISERMLALAREKVARRGLAESITLQRGDAEALDFADGAFDAVTVAFGVRNFGDIGAGLRQMRRVLREGGRCYVLEFSEPRVPLFGAVYRFYFHRVLPWLGRIVSRDGAAYSYLPRSVDAFPAPDEFAEMMRQAGFAAVRVRRLTGGVAYIYEGVMSYEL